LVELEIDRSTFERNFHSHGFLSKLLNVSTRKFRAPFRRSDGAPLKGLKYVKFSRKVDCAFEMRVIKKQFSI